MPVYEYECQAKKCGEVFAEYQSLADAPLKKCKVCKRGKVIKIISLPSRPVVPGDPRDEVMKMKQDARKIAQRIIKGDENAIADVYGEDAANGRASKNNAPAQKTLDSLKGKGKIKRSK